MRIVAVIALAVCAALTLPQSATAKEKLPKDVVSGWRFGKSLARNYKRYGYQVVRKKDGHPVRAGSRSIRFEVRPGDCGWNDGWNDCKKDRERHELSASGRKYVMRDGEYWFGWSIYIPENFQNIAPTKTALGQFHQKSGHVVWMFQNANGGYWIDNQTAGHTVEMRRLLTDEEMRGKWTDIAVHARWSDGGDGFFRVYVNGADKAKYAWSGPTKSKGKAVYFKFGVYRSFMSRYKRANDGAEAPGQIVYFDEVRRGRTRSDVAPRD